MTVDEKIAEQAALIQRLESSYPAYDNSVGRWHENNLPWEQHHAAVRDAYWRRRMLIAERDGLDRQKTAQVY